MAKLSESGDKEFVDHWLRVGEKLARIRRDELRRYNHDENRAIIDALLELGARRATFRPTSGLVEQQRLFQKARTRDRAGE